MLKSFSKVLSLALVVCLVIAGFPLSASAKQVNQTESGTRFFYSDYKDIEGNIVGKQTKIVTIEEPVYDSKGTKSITVTEEVKYQFNDDFEFKDRIKNTSKTTIFSVSPTGNYYINNNQVEFKQENNPIFSPMDSGGYWELTYYNCDSSYQCYMYTGSGVSFDLNTVENAYKEVYLVKNSTNNPTISDFKLYATQVANARDSYWDAGAAYSLAIVGVAGSIPFANALLAIASGGVAIYEAYKGYSAWQDINEAMSNAYSII